MYLYVNIWIRIIQKNSSYFFKIILPQSYKKLEDPLDDNGEGTSNSLNDRN